MQKENINMLNTGIQKQEISVNLWNVVCGDQIPPVPQREKAWL